MPHKVVPAGAQTQETGQRDYRKERSQVSLGEVYRREFWFGSGINLPTQGKQAVPGTSCWRPALGARFTPPPAPPQKPRRGTRVSG